MLSTESRMRGDMQVRFGAGTGKTTAERRQGVLYRAYVFCSGTEGRSESDAL